MFSRAILVLLWTLLVAGCATGPGFSGDHINTALQPGQAVADEAAVSGQAVLWGGRIIHAKPGAGVTTVEVLAFPLAGNQLPDTSKESLGRFLLIYPGYLEPEDFSVDRLLTVVGTLEGTRTGQVGEAEYRYPVVRADNPYLWPVQLQPREPQVHFGIGVGIFR